jgi:hypothetical protein
MNGLGQTNDLNGSVHVSARRISADTRSKSPFLLHVHAFTSANDLAENPQQEYVINVLLIYSETEIKSGKET